MQDILNDKEQCLDVYLIDIYAVHEKMYNICIHILDPESRYKPPLIFMSSNPTTLIITLREETAVTLFTSRVREKR